MSWNTTKIFILSLTLLTLLVLLPLKTQAFFTKQKILKSNKISSGTWEEYKFDTFDNAMQSLKDLFLKKKFSILYENLDFDLQSIYTKEEFTKAAENFDIKGFEIIGEKENTGPNQSQILVKITTSTTTEKYITVLNYEKLQWRFLGTRKGGE